jgi:hypothetical protein
MVLVMYLVNVSKSLFLMENTNRLITLKFYLFYYYRHYYYYNTTTTTTTTTTAAAAYNNSRLTNYLPL